jgi:hypothetical protein
VVHAGEVAIEDVGRFRKLFGLAVIVVHRMLKNPVPAREYLMLSEPAFASFDGFFGLEPERLDVELDGIGTHRMMVFHADQLATVQELLDGSEGPVPEPSQARVLGWQVARRARTLMDVATAAVKRLAPGAGRSRDGGQGQAS